MVFALPSKPRVANPRSAWRACLGACVLLAGMSTPATAAQAPASAPPVSLDRIKEDLARTGPRLKLDVPIPPPRPTFKSRVDQRTFVLTLEQALHRDFDITNEIQRQSANWASKCCGYDLGQLFKAVDKALQERQIRKTREQIWRELVLLEAARAAALAAAAAK
jgi:hypothetical protein